MSARECRWSIRPGGGPLEAEGHMSVGLGHHKITLAEAKASYTRRGPMVLRFCELFLGETSLAEQVTAESFVRFLRGGGRAETNGVPVALLRFTFQTASESPARNGGPSEPLRAAIIHLDALPRAVFILHGVMAVQMPWVGAILGVSAEEAARLWATGLIEIHQRLPQDFFKERGR